MHTDKHISNSNWTSPRSLTSDEEKDIRTLCGIPLFTAAYDDRDVVINTRFLNEDSAGFSADYRVAREDVTCTACLLLQFEQDSQDAENQ